MLRSFTLQPLSLVLGVVFGLACFMAMGQTSIRSTPIGTTVRVEYMPHPRDMVQIRGSTPYIVPTSELFVLTGLGNADGSGGTQLRIDGQPDLSTQPITAQFGGPSIQPITPGLTIPAGATVTLAALGGSGDATCRAYGYLVPQ